MATTATGGSLTAASPLLPFSVGDAGVVGVEVSGGGWTGTITLEARIGNTWANAQVFTTAGASAAATMTANGSRLINAAGFSEVRANFSTPTSGSPTVIFTGSPEAMGGSGGGGGGGAVTIADGADTAEGTTTDAGIITDTSGTAIGFLRGTIIQWAKLLTQTGIVTEAAPASDTASSGLNGRLQRIAQNITTMIAATLKTQGAGATGAAVSGNPVLIGVSDGTNVQTLQTESATRFNLRTAIFNGLSEANVLTPSDGGASGTVLGVDAFQSDWNGATYDRHRNSQDVSLHGSAVTGTGTVNTDIITYNYNYLVIHANVTLYNAGTVLFKVQMQDANAVFVDIPLATTGAVSTGADIFLTVGPSTWGANASPVFYANQVLPRTIRIVQTVGAASVTFSAGYTLKN